MNAQRVQKLQTAAGIPDFDPENDEHILEKLDKLNLDQKDEDANFYD